MPNEYYQWMNTFNVLQFDWTAITIPGGWCATELLHSC